MNRTAGLGISIFLAAVGAILAFAVTVDATGFNVNTAGIILLIVGVIGAAVSLIAGSTAQPGDRTIIRDREVVDTERDTRDRGAA